MNAKRVTFVVWQSYHRRGELLAQHLNADLHFICYGKRGGIWRTALRYLIQAIETWSVLGRGQPDVIFVQNPPIFCALTCYVYARFHHCRYVIDSHTGAFVDRKWRWSLALHRFLSRRALTTLVHNNAQAQIMERWKCRHIVLGFTPGQYVSGKVFERTSRFSVAVVCSFSDDEPLDAVFEAARICSDVCFYITGKPSSLCSHSIASRPENCTLTGYLPYDQYVSLLRDADAVMCLTTRDNTLLMGAMEAVSLTTPLIVSDWPVLRDTFSIGTVHVPNTPQGISQGIRRVQSERASLQHQMVTLKEQLDREWEQRFGELQQLLQSR